MEASRLENIAAFAGLTPAEREMLARVLDEFSASEGTTLVSQGEYGYEFMVIEDGTVDVIRNGELIDRMGPGDFFGELAVIAAGGQRNATIVATSPVKIVSLTGHYMRVIRERMPRIGDEIDSVIAERTHEARAMSPERPVPGQDAAGA
jgi:CRP-like cAMP-binding protein